MKILVLCLHAFEMMEFSPFIDVMGWARDDYDCDIVVDTCGFQNVVTSTFGVKVQIDILVSKVRIDDYDALVIPGGFQEYGFYEEGYDKRTLQFIQAFYAKDKWIATVCVAAFVLAKSGILMHKKATTYHLRGGYKLRELADLGVHVVDERIVVDGKLITSSCPQSAPYVAFTLLEKLISREKMELVKEAMGYAG